MTAFTVGMIPPLLPLLAAEWRLGPLEAGLVNTSYAVGRLGASYPATWFRARYGTRAAVLWGLSGMLVGSVGSGVVPGFAPFLLGRLVMGVGASAAFLAIFGELLETTPASWRGRVANAFEGTAILSLGVGGVLAAWAAAAWGWRATFVGAGLVLLAALGIGPWIGSLAGRQGARAEARGPADGRRAALAPILIAAFALSATWAGLWTTLVPLLGAGPYGLASPTLGLAFGAGYVAEFVALLAIALVIDRTRREPLFLWGSLSVLAGSVVLAAGASVGLFVVGLILVGGGFAVWMIPATVLADRAGTPLPLGALALYRVAMDAGMIVGPVLLGGLSESAGARPAVGAAGFILLAGAVALRRRPRCYNSRQ